MEAHLHSHVLTWRRQTQPGHALPGGRVVRWAVFAGRLRRAHLGLSATHSAPHSLGSSPCGLDTGLPWLPHSPHSVVSESKTECPGEAGVAHLSGPGPRGWPGDISAVPLVTELTRIWGWVGPFLSVAGSGRLWGQHTLMTTLPVPRCSPDCRRGTREAGGVRAAAGAWGCRGPGQQERGPAAVLRGAPRALAGMWWAPEGFRNTDWGQSAPSPLSPGPTCGAPEPRVQWPRCAMRGVLDEGVHWVGWRSELGRPGQSPPPPPPPPPACGFLFAGEGSGTGGPITATEDTSVTQLSLV